MRRLFSSLAFVGLFASLAYGDPCGMVPPIYEGPGSPITRVGEQRTYVFFKDGVETFVIRPGFSGKVDEFGMLIPFPNPPAIRKVPDDVFAHIAKAVDPPEIVIDLTPLPTDPGLDGAVQQSAAAPAGLQFDEPGQEAIRVIKQEAVGMYEVAVLEAGSAKALQRWMDDHGYKYPDGMDEACDDYVELGWCFVAVKTKVGQKGGVDPQPGQRNVNARLPDGSTFDGNVQGMGFRFPSKELVVPMRLSAFNKGELHNIVYLLTDKPIKIRSIPEEYVRRQVRGPILHRNVATPLPLRIIGGTERDIPKHRWASLARERDPIPHNGMAKELFASDFLAVESDTLSLPHEEQEKVLLRIGERFGLRGEAIDALNTGALKESREETLKGSLAGLKDMTLTVVDGDFPREVLAKENLTFAKFDMPTQKNTPKIYHAVYRNDPQHAMPMGGIVLVSAPEMDDSGALNASPRSNGQSQESGESAESSNATTWIILGIIGALVIGLICGGWIFGSRNRS